MHSNQVALVTGAGTGLGLEIARQLGARGITVVLGTREAAEAQAAAETLKGEGIEAHAIALDVTRAEQINALLPFFTDTFGRLDILVNNAGIMPILRHLRPRARRQHSGQQCRYHAGRPMHHPRNISRRLRNQCFRPLLHH